MAGLFGVGISALLKISYDDAAPLLEEMMSCVQIVEKAVTRLLTEDDIEEVATRVYLRTEVLKLHTDFYSPGGN
jgi:hypothetical protein